jgi:hypothetical protein
MESAVQARLGSGTAFTTPDGLLALFQADGILRHSSTKCSVISIKALHVSVNSGFRPPVCTAGTASITQRRRDSDMLADHEFSRPSSHISPVVRRSCAVLYAPNRTVRKLHQRSR